MNTLFVAGSVVVVIISAVAFMRVIRGRTVFDRLLAASAVGTNAVVLMALIGFIYARPDMFVDLALTYALLNFLGTVAAAKYVGAQEPKYVEAQEQGRSVQ